MREKFGKVLVQALKEDQGLRNFVKVEALKKFNKDYDVLYHIVKDMPLNSSIQKNHKASTYTTFRSVLLNYFNSESELIQIENQLPLLTIFVPKLPENSFSAENWNVADSVNSPAVALCMDSENDVPIFFNDGKSILLDAKYIPNLPVVVLKDSERVISNQMNGYESLNTRILNNGGSLSFKFLDENLDPNAIVENPNFINTTIPSTTSTIQSPQLSFDFIPGRETTIAPFLINSYNAFGGQATNPWQRDNIYYGLSSSNNNGILTNKYKEAITYLRLEGTPQYVYNQISQRQPGNPDPQINGSNWGFAPGAAWTEGNYEFRIWCTHGSKTDADGTNTFRIITVGPSDLFTTTFQQQSLGFFSSWLNIYVWTPSVQNIKPIDLYNGGFNGQKLIFFDWDLNDFSNRFNYKFEELDIPVTNEVFQSQTTKHNANAEVNLSTGEKTKVGTKFGGSIEHTEVSSRKWNWTTAGKNDLGIQSVHFKDNVINKHPITNQYYPSVFNAGIVTFEVRPIQINF